MDTESFIVCIKSDNIYEDIAKDVETRFDTSNYELDRLLFKGKNKKVIGLMKDNLGGKIFIKFVGLRAKTYSYLKDDSSKDNKAKGTKKCVMKRKLKFENYKNCLETTLLDNKLNYLKQNEISIDSFKKDHEEFITQQRSKRQRHQVFAEEINKVTLSSNND